MENPQSFFSDNSSGAHPKIMAAILAANSGHVEAYGNDPYTRQLNEVIKQHFGKHAEIYPVYSGTGANVLALAACLRPYQSVLCSEDAHILTSEAGAPEKFNGCKLVPVESRSGKIRPEELKLHLKNRHSQHAPPPGLISISQATEVGTLYQISEIQALAEFAKSEGLYLHVDGARISNAAAALECSFQEMLVETQVDIVSFGAAKNGLLFGDAVVVLNPKLNEGFLPLRKQGLQLASKMRFLSAQFLAFLENDLWRELASSANRRAAELANALALFPKVEIVYPVESNAVFAQFSPFDFERLQKEFGFHAWQKEGLARLMCSFDTDSRLIEQFVKRVREDS